MNHDHNSIKNAINTSLVIVVSLGLSTSLKASESESASASPFLPPGYSNKKPEPSKPITQVNGPLSRELEFRGIVQMNGVYEFSIFSKSENQSYWIAENSSDGGISIRDFDTDAMQITVTQNGRTEQLTLMTATDNPLPVITSQGPSQTAKQPSLPGLNTSNTKETSNRRVIQRRRVILPKKR
jgi:hypothetical protein